METSSKTNSEVHTHYRRDVDSLRAFAIIPVVLFHAGFSFFPGGFIGVDIFFVISGFLITGIIVREIKDKSFSILKFYERRAKRIIPALMCTIIATLVAGWFILKPEEVDALGKSAIASIGFASNIWFWRSSFEYFGPNVSLAPLLHTWSLSVEEQFYIFFPLAILAIDRIAPKHVGKMVALATVLSFALACYFVYIKPSATFYLLPTRAWELGMGSLLAIYWRHAKKLPNSFREPLSILGIGLIVIPILLYSKSMIFPGLLALAPCMGAMIIIAIGANGSTHALAFLQWPVFAFIGKISYSLYLMHWPIVVFTRYLSNSAEFGYSTKFSVVGASFVFALISWCFVEQPFRKHALNRRTIFWSAGLAMGATAVFVAGIVAFDDLKYPFSIEEAKIAKSFNDRAYAPTDCLPIIFDEGVCPIGQKKDVTKPYDFILMGDSHALSISSEISEAAEVMGQSGVMMSMICPPLLGVFRFIEPKCTSFTSAVVEWITRQPDIRTVILHARWAYYESGTDVRGEKGGDKYKLLLVRDELDKEGVYPNKVFERGFRKTIDTLLASGREVVIVEGVPEIGWDVPNALLIESRWSLSPPPAPTLDDTISRQAGVRLIFDLYKDHPRVKFIDPTTIMCHTGRCMIEHNGVPLYYDDNHLTKAASALLFRKILKEKVWQNQE